jgi:hypothetical protein
MESCVQRREAMITDREVIERLTRVETELIYLSRELNEASSMLREVYKDVVRRKSIFDILGSSFKYVVWIIVGLLGLIGTSHAPAVADWLKNLPK